MRDYDFTLVLFILHLVHLMFSQYVLYETINYYKYYSVPNYNTHRFVGDDNSATENAGVEEGAHAQAAGLA